MEISKETLYRFFAGKADREEGKEVKKYLESSEEHWNEYLRERKFFDALLLNDDTEAQEQLRKRRRFTLRRIATEAAKIAAIFVVAAGVAYLWLNESESQDIKTVIHTGHGQMANATLPDGTKVCLNSNTRLEFPAAFRKDKREINIDGEAYFEVAHDKQKPFLVHTPRRESVEVLGTKFYVEAYSDADCFETALMEGSVRVNAGGRSLTISPLQRAVCKNGKITVEKITNLDTYRWREGLICFKDEHFTDIIRGLEKYYGVNIDIANKHIKNPQLTVKFRLSDGIDYTLRILQKYIGFSYTREDEKNLFIIH